MQTKGSLYDIQRHFGWEIAICYHPMFLLVDEDRGEPVIGERKPPWGACDIEAYMERVKRNLASLEADASLVLHYEWAVCAIEDIARRFPDIFQRMKALHAKGQLRFVGGDYALVHANGQDSEVCLRELEIGQAVFTELMGEKITVFAHQETHVFEQLPTILRSLGFQYMVAPSFPWSFRLIRADHFVLSGHESGLYVTRGNEFVMAQALDGQSIPCYLPTNVRQTTAYTELIKGMWSCPPLWIDFPDLEEYHNPQPFAKPCALDDALQRRLAAAPPRLTGIIRSPFSYVEGIWAEEHLRYAREAEQSLVRTEALLAVLYARGIIQAMPDLLPLWKRLMKYEDHDATWVEVTDLRRKAIGVFQELIAHCRMLRNGALPGEGTMLINLLPRRRSTVVEAPPCVPEEIQAQQFGEEIRCVLSSPAAFARTVVKGGTVAVSRQVPVPSVIRMPLYGVALNEHGLMDQITLTGGKRLLRPGKISGGEIRAMADMQWIDAGDTSTGEGTPQMMHGPLDPQARVLSEGCTLDNRNAELSYHTGPVFDVLTRTGLLGRIPFQEDYYFYREKAQISVTLRYDFQQDALGEMHMEETKLNVYYPMAGQRFWHDVPFGIVEAEMEDQLFASNWIAGGGLVYLHHGTVKSFLCDGVLANTLAWGSKQWTNHIHYDFWMERCEAYDLRLQGKQTLRYDLLLTGEESERATVEAVEDVRWPMELIHGACKTGQLYPTGALPPMAVTALIAGEEGLLIRGFDLLEDPHAPRAIRMVNVDKRGGRV